MTEEANATPTDPVEDKEEVADEQDIDDFDDVQPPPEDEVPDTKPFDEEAAHEEEVVDDTPDFSIYVTNVAERLWRANKAAEQIKITTSPDLIKRTAEYQEWRKKMDLLNKYVDDYSAAMKALSEKRNTLFKHFALMSEGTPLYNHIGKPLTDEQLAEMQESGDMKSLEGIKQRTLTIMKVSEEDGAGSLMSHQQLAMMQDELNAIDYQSHNVNHIAEWESVVTTQLDSDVKEIRELSKRKDHYIEKVDHLRQKVNKIEHRGKGVAPTKLSDQLIRNEKKLFEADAAYEKKAHEVSVVLSEATARGWVDFYPIVKNVMKFEINRLGRQSACYGTFPATLAALKADYRDATKGSVDAPTSQSVL